MKTYRKRLTLLLICLVGVLTIFSPALATDFLQSWVAYFNSPGNLDDNAFDLEVDAAKNVYVTGTSGSDVVVLKYDSERNLLWQHILGVEVFPWTRSFLELDGAGAVYIAYTEVDEGTFPCDPRECVNMVTRKYDPSGIMQWENKFGPKLQGNVSDLKVDSADNVYVATSWNGLIKYDTNGSEQWAKPMGDIFDIEFDKDSNICVTGRISTGPGETRLFVNKYSPTGEWIAYDPDAWTGDIDGGLAVTADSEGAIYVAGVSISGSNNNIIKYKTELHCQPGFDACWLVPDWTTRFGTTVTWEWANSIALDKDGNVYISGSSRLTDTSLYDCLTAKYDSNGNKLWEARYDADSKEELAIGMVLDDNANVYVACQSVVGNPLQRDYATIMYDTDGNQIWVKRYDSPAHGTDYVSDIEVDDDGDVYVTGYISTSDGFDFATVKYTELTIPKAITSLIYTVEDMELEHGIENSLLSKINNISKLLDKGRENAALNLLQDFIDQIEDIREIKLTDGQADELISRAQEIVNLIEYG